MVQIHSDCETSWCNRYACLLGHGLGFSHYKGAGNDRIVFKPISGPWGEDDEGHCCARYIRPGDYESQSFPAAYNCPKYIEQADDGARFDLPPRQIRIKWDSNDTELPSLEVNFDKAEISFMWVPMLQLFYREVEVLDKRDRQIAAEAMQWLEEEDRTMTAVFLRACKDLEAREQHRRELRQFRIESWYCDVYNHECSGNVDPAFIFQTPPRVLKPCAEDEDEVGREATRSEAYNMLRRMEVISGNAKSSHGYIGDFLRGDWETLTAKTWAAETLAEDQRPTDSALFDKIICGPRVFEEITDEERALVCDLEGESAKAEREKRHAREKHYYEIWLGKRRS